ncbi:MAG: hypothetical protein ACK559_00425, partial [bacterium]
LFAHQDVLRCVDAPCERSRGPEVAHAVERDARLGVAGHGQRRGRPGPARAVHRRDLVDEAERRPRQELLLRRGRPDARPAVAAARARGALGVVAGPFQRGRARMGGRAPAG